MARRRRPTVETIAIWTGAWVILTAQPGAAAQSTGTGASGAGGQATSTSGRVSAPPANSAMRRAGGGTVSVQIGAAGGQVGGASTATNAMTLTSHNQSQTMQTGQGGQGNAGESGVAGQSATHRSGTQQEPSIDSTGLIHRGDAT